MLVEYKPYQIPEALLNIPVLSLRHYADRYYQAIIKYQKQNKKLGINGILKDTGSCSTLGLLDSSSVYDLEATKVSIPAKAKMEKKQTINLQRKTEKVVFIAAIQPGQSTRNRDQTRMWNI